MRKLVFISMIVVLSLSVFAQNKKGQASVGMNLGYGFDTKNVMVGADFRYSLTDMLRINPALTYYIKKDGLSAWAVDLNMNYVIPVSQNISFYPLAGVDLSFWNQRVGSGSGNLSQNKTRVGANIGLGSEMAVTRHLIIGVEVKYNIIKRVDQAIVGVRTAYLF